MIRTLAFAARSVTAQRPVVLVSLDRLRPKGPPFVPGAAPALSAFGAGAAGCAVLGAAGRQNLGTGQMPGASHDG